MIIDPNPNAARTLTLPNVAPFQIVIRNTGQARAPSGGGKLVVRSADGHRLATLKRGQSVTIIIDPPPRRRRKLRRIGGSDRLWRALRGAA